MLLQQRKQKPGFKSDSSNRGRFNLNFPSGVSKFKQKSSRVCEGVSLFFFIYSRFKSCMRKVFSIHNNRYTVNSYTITLQVWLTQMNYIVSLNSRITGLKWRYKTRVGNFPFRQKDAPSIVCDFRSIYIPSFVLFCFFSRRNFSRVSLFSIIFFFYLCLVLDDRKRIRNKN